MINVTNNNPNPHGYTLCGTEDCHGPYVVFSAYELDDPMNPHPVVCMHHIDSDIVPRLELWEAENYVDADSEELVGMNELAPGELTREAEVVEI